MTALGPIDPGLMAEFADADALMAAARAVRDKGYVRVDAFTPYPVDGLAETLGFREERIGGLALIGAIAGAGGMFLLACYVNWDYTLNIGGRPVIAVPAFLVVAFELLILGGVLTAIFGMLALNRLPRLNHPVFEVPGFERATQDRFFLAIAAADPGFEDEATAGLLHRLGASAVHPIPPAAGHR